MTAFCRNRSQFRKKENQAQANPCAFFIGYETKIWDQRAGQAEEELCAQFQMAGRTSGDGISAQSCEHGFHCD
jgi:hypothetical protein